jgi:EF-P beta-lysylation protein EpmB
MSSTWQTELAASFTRIEDLLQFLQLDPALFPDAESALALFPLKIPKPYAARMQKGNPDDPLLRQTLAVKAEYENPPDYVADPVGDLSATRTPGLLQKYHGRVLMVTTGACAIHCRYCFRRNFPYQEHGMSKRREQEALDYIGYNPDVREVILSGGDPWVLNDEQLTRRITAIAAIPHVQRLRIHTRMPVVLPSRITSELLALLESTRLQVVVVIHANHPRELDQSVEESVRKLRQAGCHLLNQAVLLKTINDSAETLMELSETLFAMGVMPYYLHLLDKARGTAHFEVSETKAVSLMQTLRNRLPGYLVPKLVKEEAGQPCKTPVDSGVAFPTELA